MNRAQRVLLLAERRMGGGPVLMFHGTSTKYLRQILKMGFVPDARQKTWQDDPDASFYRASRASFPGTYFTERVGTAYTAAGNTIRKFGGNRVLVVAQIQQRSGLPDEDNIVNVIEQGISNISNDYYVRQMYTSIQQGWSDWVVDIYKRWVSTLAEVLRVDPKTIQRHLALPMFVAIITRKAAHIERSYDFTPPDRSVAEQEYRRELANFMRSTKSLAINYRRGQEPRDAFGHNVRIEEPVTYRGRNRILAVYEERDDGSVVVRYGRPLSAFERGWEASVGPIRWASR